MVKAQIRFNKRIAPLILKRTWHKDQEIVIHKNGDIKLSLPVSADGPWKYYHIIKWILSWGRDAKVLAPAELKNAVKDNIKTMLESY